MIGLTMDRAHLYARIDQRVDIMLERGLLDEIRTLIKSDDDWDLHSFQGIGIRSGSPISREMLRLSNAANK